MECTHGGRRPGAGRKPSPELRRVAALARKRTPEAVQALAEIADDRANAPILRLRAAKALLVHALRMRPLPAGSAEPTPPIR